MAALATALAAALIAAAPAAPAATRAGGGAHAASPSGGALHATIRRTTYGIPHIKADSYADLGFGYGYAFAQDNLCTIAESYVTVAAQRSRFFGPDKSWTFRGNGSTVNNLNSDFFYQRINDSGIVEELASEAPPRGPKPEVRDMVRGYVAGYNRYLADVGGADGVPDPRCRGAEWVRPITELDAYRRFYQLASLASQGVAIDGIAKAAPLNGAAPFPPSQIPEDFLELPIGSNAYGLGGELTDNGKGMVLGNPHFPWDGPERLYQSQLTIPGKLNVEGASLYGVPLILIGHTDGLAWSHTVATAYRFTPFELELVPGDPTSYLVDGRIKHMKRDTVTVQALEADGTLEPRTRTLYSTEYGPMLTEILGLPLFPWNTTTAYAMADANARNFRYLNHFFDTDHAQSVDEYDAIQRRYQGIPWVNSIAADSSGESYYSMNGAIPNVPDAKVTQCATGLGVATFQALGLPVLDGSRSSCAWGDDPDAVAPGIFGSSKIPTLRRRDFVHNGNDSHWLTNPRAPLTGFARIIGNERTTRSLRTRIGLKMIEQREAGTDGLPGTGFTLGRLQEVALNNRQYAGELWRDELVAMCRQSPILPGSNGPVDVSAACPVLAAWDLRDELDSRGAILFRRFATRALASPGGSPTGNPISPFDVPFDPGDPVNTPRGLNTESPMVRQALADAVSDLRGAGIPLDAPLRDWQYEKRGEERIPIHGGPGTLGVFNAINVSWDARAGYPNVPHGSSFIMASQFVDGPCPVRTRTFVTYSQSENPGSPYFGDQTRAFSAKQWNAEPYCENEIASNPDLTVQVVSQP